MRSGDLRYRVTLQQKTSVKDSEGIVTETWIDFAEVWSDVAPLKGREYFQAAAVNAENTIRFRIRYLKGITTNMQLIYDSRTFNIRSIIDLDERHREIHLMCEEVVVGG